MRRKVMNVGVQVTELSPSKAKAFQRHQCSIRHSGLNRRVVDFIVMLGVAPRTFG